MMKPRKMRTMLNNKRNAETQKCREKNQKAL